MGGYWPGHNPNSHPLGCNGVYGTSGYKRHWRRGEKACARCNRSKAHYQPERTRGQLHPRVKQGCGTKSAAVQHRKKNEPLDFPCQLAEAAEAAARRGVGGPTH